MASVYMSARATTFREACCEKLGVSQADFEDALFWRCIPQRYLLLVKLRLLMNPACYETDLDLIATLADCTSLTEVFEELENYQSFNPSCRLPNRMFQQARLSPQLLVNFASTVPLPS